MKLLCYCLALFLLIGLPVSADDSIDFKIEDVFGLCNYEAIEQNSSIAEGMRCMSNFITPVIDMNILYRPFNQFIKAFDYAENNAPVIKKKYEESNTGWGIIDGLINIFNALLYYGTLLTTSLAIPFITLALIPDMIISIVIFTFHVIYKFLITYILWVSLGFQVIINRVDKDAKFENETKVNLTFLLMGVFTLLYLTNGWGVIWYYLQL